MGRVDYQWSTQGCLDQTKTLHLTIDPVKDNAPAAVLISKVVQGIARRCPNLAMTLSLEHCQCAATPISVLGNETFPRVTKIIVYVGRHDGDEPFDTRDTRRRIPSSCTPSADFWKPFVNGTCFPDCKDLEVRHYWATAPPTNASLDLTRTPEVADIIDDDYGRRTPAFYRGNPPRPVYFEGRDPVIPQIGTTDGVRKFERVVLECPPELTSGIFMQLLGNPNSVANKLTYLELRFCNLNTETISKLLYHAPPSLKHMVLLRIENNPSSDSLEQDEGPHLCPLIRDFGKRIIHLEYAASTVCNELFFDDVDKESLRSSGVASGFGSSVGAPEVDENFDV